LKVLTTICWGKFMLQKIVLETGEYSINDLHKNAKSLVEKLEFVQSTLAELHNKKAMMNRAKNGYISDLKQEIIPSTTGIDLSELFSDE